MALKLGLTEQAAGNGGIYLHRAEQDVFPQGGQGTEGHGPTSQY